MSYKYVTKPSWYTGAPNSTMVGEHRIVWCLAHGFTEIPDGYEIHHWDGDPSNNALSNLTCVTREEHRHLHGRTPPPKRKPYIKPDRPFHPLWGELYVYGNAVKVKRPDWYRSFNSLVPLTHVEWAYANGKQRVPDGKAVIPVNGTLTLVSKTEARRYSANQRWNKTS